MPEPARQASPTSRPGRSVIGRRSLLAFLCVVALLYAAGVNPYWRFQRDSARYMALGRSLAEHGTYRLNYAAQTTVWPGLPAMLSVVYMTVGESFLVMNILLSLFGVGCVAAGWALFRQLPLTSRQVAFCTLLFGLSRTLYYYSGHIMTDVPFTFFALVTLICGAMMLRRSGRAGWLWCGAASLAACAACFVRPVGPTLLIALALSVWLSPGVPRGRLALGRTLLILGPILAAGLAWSVRCALVREPYDSSYFEMFVGRFGTWQLAHRMLERALSLVKSLPDAVLGVDMGIAVGALLLVPMALGLAVALRRGERLVSLYGIVYLISICVANPNRRYLLPALPAIALWLVLGFQAAGSLLEARTRLMTARRATVLGYVLLAMAVGTNVGRIGKLVYEARAPGFYARMADGRMPEYFALVDWLKANAKPDDVVLAREWETIHYFSRVRTHPVPSDFRWQGQPYVLRLIQRRRISLVVLDPEKDDLTKRLRQLVDAEPDVFEPVAQVGKLEVLRVHPEAIRLPGADRPVSESDASPAGRSARRRTARP